jgi:opacity protein-like surface antigen
MKTPSTCARTAAVLALAFLFFCGPVLAQRGGDRSSQTAAFPRFNLTVGGGSAMAEDHRCMPKLMAEVQYGFSPRFRLGLGLGYISAAGGSMGRDDRRHPMGDSQMGNSLPLFQRMFGLGSGQEDGREFRLVPISLNAYYVLPLARRWDAYLSAGASYYLGTFYGQSGHLTKNSLGAQAGLGVEFRLNARMRLVAQGGYRFVSFTGLRFQRSLGPLAMVSDMFGLGGLMNTIAGFLQPRPVDVRLNGFSLTAGVRFGL